jgi:antagonist of KipI
MALKVLRAGILSTLQDLGRFGYQRFGVPVSGAMDEYSHRLANVVVGNPETEATLEVTLAGPRLALMRELLIAICGGDFQPSIDGRAVPVGRPLAVRAGCQLDLGACRQGCRAYLAVAGGFAVPEVMGSKSTYLRGTFGGFHGRALKRGDVLETGNPSELRYPGLQARIAAGEAVAYPRWSLNANAAFLAHDHHRIRFVPGRYWSQFPESSRQQFCATQFRIAPDSDRMGYRLDGLALDVPVLRLGEIPPEGVTFGSIQVPPDGRPIILMANRQTTGGYPRIGEVASVDLPLLAQLPPGDTLRFEPIDLEESQALYLQRDREIAIMREALELRMKG